MRKEDLQAMQGHGLDVGEGDGGWWPTLTYQVPGFGDNFGLILEVYIYVVKQPVDRKVTKALCVCLFFSGGGGRCTWFMRYRLGQWTLILWMELSFDQLFSRVHCQASTQPRDLFPFRCEPLVIGPKWMVYCVCAANFLSSLITQCNIFIPHGFSIQSFCAIFHQDHLPNELFQGTQNPSLHQWYPKIGNLTLAKLPHLPPNRGDSPCFGGQKRESEWSWNDSKRVKYNDYGSFDLKKHIHTNVHT